MGKQRHARPYPVVGARQADNGAARVAVAVGGGADDDAQLAALGVVACAATEHDKGSAVGKDDGLLEDHAATAQ